MKCGAKACPSPQFADQLFAVAVRQAEVDDHQVRLAAGGVDQRAFDAVGLEHLEALILQGDADKTADVGLVFNNQNACSAHAATSKVAFGDIEVDLATHEVWRQGLPVHLTPIEYHLLCPPR